jgi:hypothetical protein
LDGFVRPQQAAVLASEIETARGFHSAYSLHDRTRTFLKVQDGCDYSCTFCTIPLARGNSRSDSIAQVVRSASRWYRRCAPPASSSTSESCSSPGKRRCSTSPISPPSCSPPPLYSWSWGCGPRRATGR